MLSLASVTLTQYPASRTLVWTDAKQVILVILEWHIKIFSERAFCVHSARVLLECDPADCSMPSPAQPSRRDLVRVEVRTVASTISRLWGLFQVELHGRFSIQRVERMRAYYTSTGWLRVLLVCIFTPLTPLVVITSLDCMQLGSPKLSSNENVAFWIRSIIATPIIVVGAVYLFHCCLSVLPMTYCEAMGVSFVSSVAGVAFAYGVSMALGFPVPFTLVVQSVAIMPTMIAGLYLLWRRTLRGNPSLQADLRRQTMAFLGQVGMIWVYPIYFFAFTSMPSFGQSVFTLVLPMIKLAFKNYFSHALRQLDDIKPAFVVFNADVFSALYVVNCLQASRSGLNLLLIMLIDIVQMAVSIHDIRVVLREIRKIIQMDQFDGSLLDLCELAAGPPQVRKELDRRSSSSRVNAGPPLSAVPTRAWRPIIVPAPSEFRPTSAQNTMVTSLRSAQRIRLVHKIGKVLYIAEFLLIIEFVEVMIPVIYSLYLVVMSNLPNRMYYTQLASLNEHELRRSIATVILNAFLEFASLIVACVLLRRELKLSSPHLLAFALESQSALVQNSLMTWILYVIQQSLIHTGVDFSMHFAWLRGK